MNKKQYRCLKSLHKHVTESSLMTKDDFSEQLTEIMALLENYLDKQYEINQGFIDE